ncbi:hypothetical protein DSO57_1012003 [Entomophthora muscae]|uniref:Uncharacterized protein n=1 Tax=Entomophthora muscae TaxID=34485 RepID=A0ACC2UEY6_9FUNG|nr:hypothetical protein DSO57_1012003 [Entomophthora muscae]
MGRWLSYGFLPIFAGDQWDDAEDSPYDTTIKSTLVQCLTSLTDDVMFISYYKLSIAFDDFGKQGKATAKNRRKKVKKGTFIGAFLAVSAKGFVYYWTNPDFIDSYSYSHILGGLLNSWDGSNSKYWVFLSHQMEGSSTALEAIQGRRHQASVYPAGHADIYLADVVFFNMGSTLWECRPQAFNDLYLGVLDHNFLFGCQIVADLFVQMVAHVNTGNQSQKDKRLPPCVTSTYQPIQPMTDKEYEEHYMAAITQNPPPPPPTPPTCKPNPSNPRPPRPALPLRLPSRVILPPRHLSGIHSLGSLFLIEWRRAPKLNLIRVQPTGIPIISMCRR